MLKPEELFIDYFAGGGGASTGIEAALGRSVDIAVNHDPEALAMHAINHPKTRHLCEDIFNADIAAACAGRPIGAAWYSPDCTYHSIARGGKPIREEGKRIRALSIIVLKHARNPATRPRLFFLENVREFQHWGPLDKNGQPCKKRKGVTFRLWWRQLERLGYRLEMRELRGCDYGAPTIRKRLFIVGRCDGLPIVWPEATHGDPKSEAVKSGRLKPWRTAADCIDFDLPCPSIFGRKRPLAYNTERRLAHGFNKTIGSTLSAPIGTLTTHEKDSLVFAYLAKHYGGVVGHKPDQPIGTITSTDHHSLVSGHLVKLKGTCRDGQPLTKPISTVQANGQHIGYVCGYLVKYYGTDQDPRLREPLHTVTSKDRFGYCQTAMIHVDGLTDEQRYSAWCVARFLEKYIPERFSVPEGCERPSMVILGDYAVVDLGMRMLQPRELYRAQGFPDSYVIEFDYNGKPLPKSSQVRMCGNSVNKHIAEALVRANLSATGKQTGFSERPAYQRRLL